MRGAAGWPPHTARDSAGILRDALHCNGNTHRAPSRPHIWRRRRRRRRSDCHSDRGVEVWGVWRCGDGSPHPHVPLLSPSPSLSLSAAPAIATGQMTARDWGWHQIWRERWQIGRERWWWRFCDDYYYCRRLLSILSNCWDSNGRVRRRGRRRHAIGGC